jgi:DNA-binding beta-propeller fold protein YncE
MAMTNDGQLLVAAGRPRTVFLDVQRLIADSVDPVLGYWSDGNERAGQFYVNITSDDRYVFVSNEDAESISVLDLARARASGFLTDALIGTIPVGTLPIALTFSRDERYLFSTSQSLPERLGRAITCRPERDQQAAPDHAVGAIYVIDMRRAVSDPARSVVGTVEAGCNPVRLVLSPEGDTAYVSARGEHQLLVFDAGKLVDEPTSALLSAVPAGTSPVGVAALRDGRVLVTSSNRFAGTASERRSLLVVDSTKVHLGSDAVTDCIETGAFPRELRVSRDGRSLFVTNFDSQTLQVVDLDQEAPASGLAESRCVAIAAVP